MRSSRNIHLKVQSYYWSHVVFHIVRLAQNRWNLRMRIYWTNEMVPILVPDETEVSIHGAGQMDRSLWGREWMVPHLVPPYYAFFSFFPLYFVFLFVCVLFSKAMISIRTFKFSSLYGHFLSLLKILLFLKYKVFSPAVFCIYTY